ncbi:hypothetical protein MIND_01415400 [Mycena indigotica]|uniref:Uncharacterized protein n=1 Tax=Mycena indigotica TaxID=2126181 RepID=A0A8H6RZ19_9AGAR|nr:uncharacterized protein MIND_01415400 [Mycena indigotica]KAF7288986.1 hypothetical protein MIND_01415400 [Mycena indigotica]
MDNDNFNLLADAAWGIPSDPNRPRTNLKQIAPVYYQNFGEDQVTSDWVVDYMPESPQDGGFGQKPSEHDRFESFNALVAAIRATHGELLSVEHIVEDLLKDPTWYLSNHATEWGAGVLCSLKSSVPLVEEAEENMKGGKAPSVDQGQGQSKGRAGEGKGDSEGYETVACSHRPLKRKRAAPKPKTAASVAASTTVALDGDMPTASTSAVTLEAPAPQSRPIRPIGTRRSTRIASLPTPNTL